MFQHATESRERVLSALQTVSGGVAAGGLKETAAEGYHGNPIFVLEVELASKESLAAFWERLRAANLLGGIEESLEERVSEDGELHIRFDKQAAVEGRLSLSSGDDVVAARARVLILSGGRPVRSGREAAVAELRRFLRALDALSRG